MNRIDTLQLYSAPTQKKVHFSSDTTSFNAFFVSSEEEEELGKGDLVQSLSHAISTKKERKKDRRK